jgi:SAM-dependent methyltransferase
MSGNDPAHFFDAIAGRYERAYTLPPAESKRRMARILAELPPAPSRVLDLGVGTGRELSALLDAGHEPTGLDCSEAMLSRCARRARPVPLIKADFWQPLPFADRSFDATIALHGTLAHAPTPEAIQRLARELARVVRAGGTWVAEVPAPAWLERLTDGEREEGDGTGRRGGAASGSPTGPGRARRTGRRSGAYADSVADACIDVLVLDEREWESALGTTWTARIEPLGEFEWLVLATRSR